MLKSAFSQDAGDPDTPVREAAAETPEGTVRLRIQPMVLSKRQYRSWPQMSWLLDCDSAEEAFAIRDSLRVFFEALMRCGPKAVQRELAALQPPKPTRVSA